MGALADALAMLSAIGPGILRPEGRIAEGERAGLIVVDGLLRGGVSVHAEFHALRMSADLGAIKGQATGDILFSGGRGQGISLAAEEEEHKQGNGQFHGTSFSS